MPVSVNALITAKAFSQDGVKLMLPDGLTIAEHLGEQVDTPGLEIYLNGHLVLRPYWCAVKPKPGTEIIALVPIQGGSKKGKNPLATIAAVVVAAAVIAVSQGNLALVLGPSFGAKTLGASIAGAALGIVGNLAIAALFPPPSPGGRPVEEGEQFKDQSIPGNLLEAGGSLPRVVGTHLVTPPQGAVPITRIVNGEEQISAFFALAGPHKFEEVRVNGSPVDETEQVQYEVREGWDDDPPLSLVTEQNFVSNTGQELSTFRLDTIEDSSDLDNQAVPENASPQWHRFTSRTNPDQIDLRVQFVALQDSDRPTKQTGVPIRIRMRLKGATAWRNFPELWFNGLFSSLAAREIRILWGDNPTGEQAAFGDGITKNGFVGYKTAVPLGNTVISTAEEWNADDWFDTESVRRDKDGVTFFINEDDIVDPTLGTIADGWPKGIYEIEVKRGQQFFPKDWNFDGYGFGSSTSTIIKSMFDPERIAISGQPWSTVEDQTTKKSKVIISNVISRWYEHPLTTTGIASLAIKVRGFSISQLGVIASGYVPDWNGREWTDWRTTSNPAPHYRYALVGPENANPLPDDTVDSLTLSKWRQECDRRDYACNMLLINESVSTALNKIAAAGFAVPRQSDTWAVTYEHDRSNDFPRQVFTPYNSRNYAFRKAFEFQPAQVKSTFFDKDNDYRQTEHVTSNNEEVAKQVDIEAIQYPGLVTEAEIERRARFDMGQIIHRGVEHSIEIPVEYLMSRKGDLVGFETDIMSRHLEVREITAASGSTVTLNDGFAYADNTDFFATADIFAVDDILILGETSYGLVMNASGISTRKITAFDSGTLVATLDAAPTEVAVGDRFIIGLGETVIKRMLIRSIEPLPGLTANITMVDEAPELVEDLLGATV